MADSEAGLAEVKRGEKLDYLIVNDFMLKFCSRTYLRWLHRRRGGKTGTCQSAGFST
jgi:hypothetical protein